LVIRLMRARTEEPLDEAWLKSSPGHRSFDCKLIGETHSVTKSRDDRLSASRIKAGWLQLREENISVDGETKKQRKPLLKPSS